jgi:hypothetical protein
MKAPTHSKIKIIVLPPPSRFATYTPKDWANALIIILAVLLIGFIISHLFH